MSINQNLELVIISFTLVNSVRELKEEECRVVTVTGGKDGNIRTAQVMIHKFVTVLPWI